MKKRILALTLALACLFSLSACQSGGTDQAEAPYTTDLVQSIADAGAFSEALEPLEGDIAFALYGLANYGLTLNDLADCALIRSTGATCEEAAVLIFSGLEEEQLVQAEQALKDYIQAQIDSNTDYRPAEIPKLEHALVSRRGETFLLVVANDLDAAKSVL